MPRVDVIAERLLQYGVLPPLPDGYCFKGDGGNLYSIKSYQISALAQMQRLDIEQFFLRA